MNWFWVWWLEALGNIIGWWCGGRWILRCGQDRTRGHTTELVGEETNVRSHHNTRTYHPRVTHLLFFLCTCDSLTVTPNY